MVVEKCSPTESDLVLRKQAICFMLPLTYDSSTGRSVSIRSLHHAIVPRGRLLQASFLGANCCKVELWSCSRQLLYMRRLDLVVTR